MSDYICIIHDNEACPECAKEFKALISKYYDLLDITEKMEKVLEDIACEPCDCKNPPDMCSCARDRAKEVLSAFAKFKGEK